MTGLYQINRHPLAPVHEGALSQSLNRGEGPFVFAGKHKVSQGYSPADLPILAKKRREWGPENAGSLTPFEMTFCNWFE
jgi:hypothetical protein